MNRNLRRAAAPLLLALTLSLCACQAIPPVSSSGPASPSGAPGPSGSSEQPASQELSSGTVSGPSATAVPAVAVDPAQLPDGVTPAMQELIDRGEVVVSEDPVMPCYNAAELADFYDLYRAKGEGSIDIYQFRKDQNGADRYTITTLGVTRRKTTVTLDTTYDPAEGGALPGAQIASLGSFTCSINRYGHLIVDVQAEDGSVRQLSYQMEDYEDLYPGYRANGDEYGPYLEPILYTGLLEQSWESATALVEESRFPFVFDSMAGEQMAGYYTKYWDSEQKVYHFPQELVENAILPHFDLTTRQLRQSMPGYRKETQTYDFPGRPGMAPVYARIVRVNLLEESLEDTADVFYELFDQATGATSYRGRLKLSLDGQGGFCYLSNELLYDRSNPEIGQE